MCRITHLFAAAALTLAMGSASALSVLERIESSYELSLGDVTLPGSAAGNVILQECPECKPVSLRVSAATRYFVNGREYSLADFKAAAAAMGATDQGAQQTAVYVHYDIDTNRVRRVRLSGAGQ